MKFTSAIFVTLAAFAPAALAQDGLIQVEVRYTGEMVDVGNLEMFHNTWERIYAETGNQRAILTDDTYDTFSGECISHWTDGPNRNVRVQISGQWGRVSGLGHHEAREALVHSLWEVLSLNADPTGYHVYTNCYNGLGLRDIPSWYWDGPSACGRSHSTVSSQCFCEFESSACEFHSWGHMVPSSIRANLYRDGVLLADSLTIDFASNRVDSEDGCNRVAEITSALAGVLPFPGPLFAAGIDVFCG
ncbi:hypothetical protein DL764_010278 [Monosporascus ibericus]|uniref:Uncharacterized protein n=1 Tax=Monosporascus ibericus TaxID=155417 RepID=A0A4Q4SSY4_9PEZI|nr:hypothetical protein DL764_010278 [Monosporascus ibericus]